jgi:HK97 gp10 family phage protein
MENLKGADEMQRRFTALRNTVKGAGANRAVQAGAKVILLAMQENAVDGPEKTALSTALPPGTARTDLKVRMRADEFGNPAALIGPSAKTGYVWRFVEYGHRIIKGGQNKLLGNGKTRGNGKYTGEDVPAHPRLRPAFEGSAQPAREAFLAQMKQEIGEVRR